jgi:metacaspase-1
MKIVLFILFILPGFISFSQTKRALVITIGQYAPLNGKGWRTISSVNDTSLVLPSLRNQAFKKENIQLLINDQATIDGIRTAFEQLSSTVKPKDIVVIHISAHGEQILDDNNDEQDGLDESIVAYDAILPKHSTNYDQDVKKYFRDDELGLYIDKIRAAAGKDGEVLVFMDNCHSGSGTRAIETYRGGEAPFVPKKPNPSATKETSVSVDKYSNSTDLAPFIVISASRADELNAEIKLNNKGFGSLSYAISKAFDNLNPNSTYNGFYTHVQAVMSEVVPKQHPVIEGNALSRKLWGGDFMLKPAFFNIIQVKDEKMVVIDGGIVSGLSKGSIVHLYPSDTYDTTKAKAISIGTVHSLENFKATIDLQTELPDLNAPYWAFLKKVYYPVSEINVGFDTLNGKKDKLIDKSRVEAYHSILKKNEFINSKSPSSLRIVQRNGKDVLVDNKTDFAIDTLGNGQPNEVAINASIQRYLQYQFLKSYVINDTNYRIEARILPYVCTNHNGKSCQGGNVDSTLIQQKMQNGVYAFMPGDYLAMSITNNSKQRIYFNVIDLEPTGKINMILPKKESDPKKMISKEDLYVEPGQTKVFDSFPIKISPPFGEEVFKVFVSNKPLDLQYITGQRGAGDKGFTGDLERVFKNSYRQGSRGDISTRDGSVMNLPFEIVPKKN